MVTFQRVHLSGVQFIGDGPRHPIFQFGKVHCLIGALGINIITCGAM